ncbi:unnamed protein product [Echinostoma caproni]|uniref:Clathrin_bdg domain-containing protein n=1 Tax=Echinostoma caproni TaxID=27848 RepID=A0A183ALY4_9TREM|nr:unnamed protein product [Echinostoma caproni]
MDPPLASVEATNVMKESDLFAHNHANNLENESTEIIWSDRAESAEILSDSSDLSSDHDFEMPKDVPDGPEFSDLAAHIGSVVESLISAKKQTDSSLSLNGMIDSQPSLQTEEPASSATSLSRASPSVSTRNLRVAKTCPEEESTGTQQAISQQPVQQETSEIEGDSNLISQNTPRLSAVIEADNSADYHPKDIESISFPGGIEPFAFFPTEDASRVDSDQWAWPPDVSTAISIPPSGDDSSDAACLHEKDLQQHPEVHATESESDEDFGEFEGCQTAILTQENPTDFTETERVSQIELSEDKSILGRLLQHLEPTLAKAFETSTTSVLNDWVTRTRRDELNNPTAEIECEHPPASLNSATHCESTFWNNLFTHSRAHDARLQWSKSLLYDAYLRSVNVDVRSAMPAFASQLRLLEPIRLGASSAQTTYITTTAGKPALSISAGTSNTTASSGAHSESENTAPEFDWNSSGLTNPLGVSSTIEPQLDLDFFEVQSETNSNSAPVPKDPKISELELELFATTLPPPVPSNPPTTQSVLNGVDLMSQSSAAAVSDSKPTTFSSTVRAVVAKLPKLRYMRARNLIFPIPETETN